MRLLLALVLLSAPAFAEQKAKVVLNLDASPAIKETVDRLWVKSNVRKKADRCSTNVEVNYAGLKNRRIKSSEYALATSLTSGKVNKVEAELDPASAPNDRKLELYEHCRYSETVYYPCNDYEGKPSTCSRTDDYDAVFGFVCEFKGLAEVAKTEKMSCKLESPKLDYRFRTKDLNPESIKRINEAGGLELAVETKSLEKTSSNTIVRTNGGRKVWIRLIEGVTGHDGEDDFEYTIDIDGEQVTAKIPDGQLNYDVEYHTNAKSVNVGVKAVERDLFFDDHYVSQNDLTLNTRPPGNTGTIHLKRSTYFGELMTYKDHTVTVIVTEDEPARLDLDTAAVLAIEATKRDAVKDWGKAINGTTRALKSGEKYVPEKMETRGSSGSWDAN